VNGYVRAYKMIFAVLDRRLNTTLSKMVTVFINNTVYKHPS